MINKIVILVFFIPIVSFADNFYRTNRVLADEGDSLSNEYAKCGQYPPGQTKYWSCLHYERFVPKTPSVDVLAKILLDEANKHYDMENYKKAEYSYRQVLKVKPELAAAWVELAHFYSDLNRDADALQILKNSSHTLPENADISYEMGLIQVRLRLPSEAIVSIAKAAQLAPENPHYSYVYGIAMNSTQGSDEALAILQKAHQLHPENQALLKALISIHQDNGQNIEALEYAQILLKLEPDEQSIQDFVRQLRSTIKMTNNTDKK